VVLFLEVRHCGCGVVPLYQGKGGEGELACDVMGISHRDQNRKKQNGKGEDE